MAENSYHWTKRQAQQRATSLRIDTPRQGRSSGWSRLDFGYRRRKGFHLKRWEVYAK